MNVRYWWFAGLFLAACSSAPANRTPSEDASSDTDASPGSGDVTPDTDGSADAVETGCVDPDNDGYGPGCSLGDDCRPLDVDINPGAGERCGDLVDNNCNDEVDEDCGCADGAVEYCYEGPEGTVDVGICLRGTRECVDGEWGVCSGQITPAGTIESICDGLDEDCNGVVDDGVRNACGVCGPVPPEVCGDGFDNNCDGVIDEVSAGCDCDERDNQPCYAGPPVTLGVGLCAGGLADCGPEGELLECEGQVLPTGPEEDNPALCDGLDNDCDGLVDAGLRNACGECAATAPVEVCDGVDNDCDGEIDEGVRLACGLCPAEVGTEVCGDGFDNDCDGNADENCSCTVGEPTCYPGPVAAAGVGVCQLGSRTCDASGEFWSECTGFVLPTVEICDGLDNNCDGFVDIGPNGCSVCGTELEICDGIDNDCDGLVDEFLRNTCGDCLADVVPEEEGGAEFCDGVDNDCDGFTDESLVNACGVCDDTCYVEVFSGREDWEGGELQGIDPETLDEGLRLGQARFTFPDLWVANATDGTVTRINTEGVPSVVDTYTVGLSPSRTAVDFNGDVWVANRAFGAQGTVSKIQAEGCTGEACVLFTVDVGGVDQLPRALAIDREGFAWVGTYADGVLYRLNPATGAVVEQYPTGLNIYGIAIDREGIIWIATLNSAQGIGAFDTSTKRMLGNWTQSSPYCLQPYGIAVDGDGNVWFGNWTCNGLVRLNRSTFDAPGSPVTFTRFTGSGMERTRGVAVDGEGIIYTASSNTNRLTAVDPAADGGAGAAIWSAATCGSPIGVGIAADNNIWTMCQSANQAQQFAPSGGSPLVTLPTGAGPYSYSDMTGFQLRNFTAPRGIWRQTFACRPEPLNAQCKFDEVSWSATVVPDTAVSVRARTSEDTTTWSEWSVPATTTPLDTGSLPRGRYLQVEVQLTTNQNDLTPIVSSLQVLWQRP